MVIQKVKKGKYVIQIGQFTLISLSSLILLILFYMFYQNKESITDYLHDSFVKFETTDATELKVLFCPLSKSRSVYEGDLVKALTDLEYNDTFNLKVKRLINTFPATNLEAENVASRKNADLIVWGNLLELDNGAFRISLRYNFVGDYLISKYRKRGETNLIFDYEKGNLRRGVLPNDINNLLYWLSAIVAHKKGELKKASYFLEKFDSAAFIDNKSYQFFHSYSIILNDINQPELARTLQAEALRILENILPFDLDKISLAENYTNYAEIMLNLGQLDSANFFIEKSSEVLSELSHDKKLSELNLVNLTLTSKVLLSKEERDSFCLMTDRILDLSNIQNLQSFSNLSTIYSNKALCLQFENLLDSAIEFQNKAIELEYSKTIPSFSQISKYYKNLAYILLNQDRLTESYRYTIKALDLSKTYLPGNDPVLAEEYNSATENLYLLGKYEDALKYIDAAIKIAEFPNNLESDRESLSNYYSNKAVILDNLKEFEESLIFHAKAMSEYELATGTKNPLLLNNLADTYLAEGGDKRNITKIDSAIYTFQSLLRETPQNPSKNIAYFKHNIARAYYTKYQIDNDDLASLKKAEAELKESIILKKQLPTGQSIENSYTLLTIVSYHMGDKLQALNSANSALNILERMYPDGRNQQIDSVNYYIPLIEKMN